MMKHRLGITLFGLLLFVPLAVAAPPADVTLAARDAKVEGIKLHYLIAGHGPAVILLHGYTQTSRMWRPIIPLLAEKFTVIAPDLPGYWRLGDPKGWAGHENLCRPHSRTRQIAGH